MTEMVIQSVSAALKEKFPEAHIYLEEAPELLFPAFIVSLASSVLTRELDTRQRAELQIQVVYLTEEHQNKEDYAMIPQIAECLWLFGHDSQGERFHGDHFTATVKDRALYIRFNVTALGRTIKEEPPVQNLRVQVRYR